MTKSVCDELFKKDVTWVLGTIPCNGFYANILGYLKSHYPSLGTLLSKIDPHLAAIVNTSRPLNFLEEDMDTLVTYTPKNAPTCTHR